MKNLFLVVSTKRKRKFNVLTSCQTVSCDGGGVLTAGNAVSGSCLQCAATMESHHRHRVCLPCKVTHALSNSKYFHS